MNAATSRRLRSARHAGFTLPELLMASVLGAMLLTSLAVTTYGYTRNLDHLEKEAGVTGKDVDPVLRRMTRDIREAWWVELPSSSHINIAAPNGEITQYYSQDSKLYIERPDGDKAAIYTGFQTFTMETATMNRFREGSPTSHDGTWYSTLGASGAADTIEVHSGESLAIAFTAPALPEDVPGGAAVAEQLLTVQTSVFELPMEFEDGTGEKKVSFTIYEGWAPGRGRPTGTALASVTLNGYSLPEADEVDGVWHIPTSVTPVSLSTSLTPGVGYTLVIKTLGSGNTLVMKRLAQAEFPDDQVLKQGTGGNAPWVSQMSVVPLVVKGPWTQTATAVTSVVNRVTITIIPLNRPLQQRSAVVLSQGMSEDPWMGVVPGEAAP